MAYTSVSDVVIPEVYNPYIIEDTVSRWAFIRAGIVTVVDEFAQFLDGGGKTFTTPYWENIVDDSTEPVAIQSGTELVPTGIGSDKFDVRRLVFGKGWADEDLAGALAGDNPGQAVAVKTSDYWMNFMNKVLISTVKGIVNDNVANFSSDLVNDISKPDEADIDDTTKINRDGIIDTQFLMEDHQDKFNGGAIAMHSDVYKRLTKLNAIDMTPENVQNIGFGVYGNNLSVIIDNNLPKTAITGTGSGYTYWTIVYKRGAFGFNEGGYGSPASGKIVMSETDRVSAKGQNELYTRRQMIIGVAGVDWAESSVASDMPTRAELEIEANWDRKWDKKNMGFTVLITNG